MPDELLDLLGLDPEDPEVAAALEDDQRLARLMTCLYQLRRRQGLTQAEVAERMGTTQSAVSDLERTSGDPRIGTLQRYARAVDASLGFAVVPTAKWTRVAQVPARVRVTAEGPPHNRKVGRPRVVMGHDEIGPAIA